MVLSTSQLRTVWGPACSSDRTTITLWSGAKVTVRTSAVEAFKALDAVMKAHGYFQRPGDTGAYNCRTITGGSGYSLHAYGIAQDTNWQTNPYGPRLVTDRTRAMVDDILAVRTKSGAEVFGWGGYYAGSKDAMHDEVVCSPADLASGIDWSTVAQPAAPAPSQEDTVTTLYRPAAAPGGVQAADDFWIAPDGHLIHEWFTPVDGWTSEDLGGRAVSCSAAWRDDGAQLRVLVAGVDGHPYELVYDVAANRWGPFQVRPGSVKV